MVIETLASNKDAKARMYQFFTILPFKMILKYSQCNI